MNKELQVAIIWVKGNWIKTVITLAITLLAISALWGWFHRGTISPNPDPIYIPVPQIKEVVKVKTVYVDVSSGKVRVLDKAEVVKRLKGLPEEVVADTNKQFTVTGVIAPYKGKTNVLSVIDTKSGVSTLISKKEPLSLFAIEQDRYAGMRIGSTGNITAFAEWNFLRVGKAHVGAYGQYGTTSKGEIGLQGKIEF